MKCPKHTDFCYQVRCFSAGAWVLEKFSLYLRIIGVLGEVRIDLSQWASIIGWRIQWCEECILFAGSEDLCSDFMAYNVYMSTSRSFLHKTTEWLWLSISYSCLSVLYAKNSFIKHLEFFLREFNKYTQLRKCEKYISFNISGWLNKGGHYVSSFLYY